MNERFLLIDAASVKSAVANLKAQYPEIEEDTGLFLDVLEGETNLLEVIDQALELKLDADEMATAIKSRIDTLEVRKKRYESKSSAMKDIIHALMDTANQTKVVRPVATVSVTVPREKTTVSNVDELPQGYFRMERKADLTAITAALKGGEEIPGALLERSKPGLTIRTK